MLKNDILVFLGCEKVAWSRVVTAIFVGTGLPSGLDLSVLCCCVSLLLVCNLLQSVKFLSVQLIQLGVDVCIFWSAEAHQRARGSRTFDGILGSWDDNMLAVKYQYHSASNIGFRVLNT